MGAGEGPCHTSLRYFPEILCVSPSQSVTLCLLPVSLSLSFPTPRFSGRASAPRL